MRTLLAVVAALVVGAVVAVAVVLALSDDESPRAAAASPQTVTTAECLEIIPDSVFETLGWTGAAATEHAGRCQKYGDDGNVTVGDLAVVGASKDRPEAAEKVYDERCSGLFEHDDATPELDAEWLPEGTTACARLLPPGKDMGIAELFLLTDADEVIQVRLAARTATSEDKVQAALAELVETAQRQW